MNISQDDLLFSMYNFGTTPYILRYTQATCQLIIVCVCVYVLVYIKPLLVLVSGHRGGVTVTPNNDKSQDVCLIGF